MRLLTRKGADYDGLRGPLRRRVTGPQRKQNVPYTGEEEDLDTTLTYRSRVTSTQHLRREKST